MISLIPFTCGELLLLFSCSAGEEGLSIGETIALLMESGVVADSSSSPIT